MAPRAWPRAGAHDVQGSRSAAGRVLAPRGGPGRAGNAFTSLDYTGYYQQIPAHRLEDVMRLEADHSPQRMARRRVPQGDRGRQEERRLRTEDQPRALLWEQLSAAAFTASPTGGPSSAG